MRFGDEDTAELLEQATAARDWKPDWPTEVPTKWMSAFLAEEIATLQRQGVERFGFYSVRVCRGPMSLMPAASAPRFLS